MSVDLPENNSPTDGGENADIWDQNLGNKNDVGTGTTGTRMMMIVRKITTATDLSLQTTCVSPHRTQNGKNETDQHVRILTNEEISAIFWEDEE